MALFTELEVTAIRHLILQTASPDDAALSRVSPREPNSLRKLIRRHLALILDPSTPLSHLRTVFNQPTPKPPPPPLTLPPKYRDKARFPSEQIIGIPTLPRYETPPPGNHAPRPAPQIGSLVAVIHPDLGSCVCRVLARSPTQHTFLIVCFQATSGPYWVPADYLFGFNSAEILPLRDEEAFQKEMVTAHISVDWLLERILSAGQHLVTSNGDLLVAVRQKVLEPEQIQRLVMHCVGCAALLIFCRIVTQWRIVSGKRVKIRETIERVMAPNFASTKAILANVERLLETLSGGD
jgi:hypothetical protein